MTPKTAALEALIEAHATELKLTSGSSSTKGTTETFRSALVDLEPATTASPQVNRSTPSRFSR